MLASRQAQSCVKCLESSQIAEVEPELGTRFSQALYVPGEAQIDNRGFLEAVGLALEETAVECHWETALEDGSLPDSGIIVDCRGMGAKSDMRNLRGVRGEIVRLQAPEIELNHMLRLLHPRCPVYIVPRADGKLVVGATTVESEDRSPASVRGVLELLASAYSILPALAEARILEFNTQVRPMLVGSLRHYAQFQLFIIDLRYSRETQKSVEGNFVGGNSPSRYHLKYHYRWWIHSFTASVSAGWFGLANAFRYEIKCSAHLL